MTTEKKYTVTSQNCVKPLVDLDHGTMFVFPNQAEKLCIVCNDMSGNYSWVEICTGNSFEIGNNHVEVNPVSNFSAQITLA